MEEKTLLFKPIRDILKKEVFIASFDDSIKDIASLMKKKNISGVIIAKDNYPLGIITDRDFRNKIIAEGTNPETISARQIMTSPVLTIREDNYIFEAIYKMAKNNIHRIVVVDEMGMISGILTDTDIIRFQTNTPLYFTRELEHAGSFDDLKNLSDRIIFLIDSLISSGIKTFDLIRFISHVNDSIIKKCIEFVLSESYLQLPSPFAFLVLGSEGRMEQTLKTDQDNAIVYVDGLTDEDIEKIRLFSEKLIEALIYIGIPECPGGIMAKNEFWRRSLSGWKKALRRWISTPTPENILNYSMFSDLRTLYGDETLERNIKEEIKKLANENRLFLAHMAKNSLRFFPPLGLFGSLKLEKSGENKGKLDIKKAAIFPITEGIKILALEAGIVDGGTFSKIKYLNDTDLISKDDLLEIEASFDFFTQIRLKNNLIQLSKGEKPSNFINPNELNRVEKKRLISGFKVIKNFQSFLKDRYQLDFLK